MQTDINSRTGVLDLSAKQDVITDNSLPIIKVQNLQTTLNNKYDKSKVDTLLAGKQDTIMDNSLPIAKITNLQSSLDSKAFLTSPAFIGVPTAPTAATSSNTTQIATTASVKDVIAQIVDGAPDAMNTLKEISQALNDDKNYFATITNTSNK